MGMSQNWPTGEQKQEYEETGSKVEPKKVLEELEKAVDTARKEVGHGETYTWLKHVTPDGHFSNIMYRATQGEPLTRKKGSVNDVREELEDNWDLESLEKEVKKLPETDYRLYSIDRQPWKESTTWETYSALTCLLHREGEKEKVLGENHLHYELDTQQIEKLLESEDITQKKIRKLGKAYIGLEKTGTTLKDGIKIYIQEQTVENTVKDLENYSCKEILEPTQKTH